MEEPILALMILGVVGILAGLVGLFVYLRVRDVMAEEQRSVSRGEPGRRSSS